jgi:hypothetical protein
MESSPPADLNVSNWDEVDALGLWAIDGEVVDFAQVIPLSGSRVGVVGVVAACAEANCTLT